VDLSGLRPFSDQAAFAAWLAERARSDDPLFFAIIEQASGGRRHGEPSEHRAGHGLHRDRPHLVCAALQKTRGATEAIFLMMRHVFDGLGYRRLEWKCNALNEASVRAARRFGFTYEGTFRQHMVVKGRNRDTAWFSLLDREWPAVRAAFERWLAPANFDAAGRQRISLMALMADRTAP
jgi:RimJ/RimL family protein N-acetyltransferase